MSLVSKASGQPVSAAGVRRFLRDSRRLQRLASVTDRRCRKGSRTIPTPALGGYWTVGPFILWFCQLRFLGLIVGRSFGLPPSGANLSKQFQ